MAEGENNKVVTICSAIENEIFNWKKTKGILGGGLKEPGLNRLIREAYALFSQLETYFTAGEKEVRAWTIR
ncbi:MAG: hypothetical protein R2827_07145 [Bdellovibrionales bacterium]